MARQITIRDDLYEALSSLKAGRSFSQVIEELLRRSGLEPGDAALREQTRLLREILEELRKLNDTLRNLRITVAEARATTIEAQPLQTEKKGDEARSLPSYLQGNPWLTILSQRRRTP